MVRYSCLDRSGFWLIRAQPTLPAYFDYCSENMVEIKGKGFDSRIRWQPDQPIRITLKTLASQSWEYFNMEGGHVNRPEASMIDTLSVQWKTNSVAMPNGFVESDTNTVWLESYGGAVAVADLSRNETICLFWFRDCRKLRWRAYMQCDIILISIIPKRNKIIPIYM